MEIFVGWDSREPKTFDACVHSIESVSPDAVIRPIRMTDVRASGMYTRPIDPKAATEFSFTRFLVPFLANSQWALFCDADFLFTRPLEELFAEADSTAALQVVKHDHVIKETIKMDGKAQTAYPRKWWSALVLWNCAHPVHQKLTLRDVNHQTGAALHRFSWVPDALIGDLSPQWHWLDGYDQETSVEPWGIHYTLGTPELGREEIGYRRVWDKHTL